ncbi:MAG: hypothetical protein ACJ74Z_18515 [Bryobacteraceae bacterium]
MTRRTLFTSLPLFLSAALPPGEYSGPKPRSKDLPYLLHGEKLIATEVQKASQSNSKEGQVFFVPGTTASARTPLVEPIFLFSPDHFRAEQLALFRLR